MKKLKKAFTLTELVIVIAVIAILAAVLIPTYTSLVRKANISADTQLCAKMNTTVTAKVGGYESMQEVINALDADGFKVGNLNPTTENYRFVWEKTSNQILLLDDKYQVVASNRDYNQANWELWLTVKNQQEVVSPANMSFNYFLTENSEQNFAITTISSFVVGEGLTLSGNLSVTSSSNGQYAIGGDIAGTITINTPSASVTHSGSVENVLIKAVKSGTYVENGKVNKKLTLELGTVENNGYIEELQNEVSGTSNVIKNNRIINSYQGPENSDSTTMITGNGYVGEDTTTGTGNRITPSANYAFNISDKEDLLEFRDLVNSGVNFKGITVKLLNDIDISSITDWTPIGIGKTNDVDNAFSGSFDGNEKEIQNLKMETATQYKGFRYQGLANSSNPTYERYAFGFFGSIIGGEVFDLEISASINIDEDKDVSNKYVYFGILAGYLQADFDRETETDPYKQVINTGVIQNVKTTGTVHVVGRAAGLVGWMDSGKIFECQNEADVSATCYKDNYLYADASGIVSWVRAGTANTFATSPIDTKRVALIEDCTNSGDMSATGQRVAGIVAAANNSMPNDKISEATLHLTIIGCDNSGSIERLASEATGPLEMGSIIGGFTGANTANSLFSRMYNCTNSGTIINSDPDLTRATDAIERQVSKLDYNTQNTTIVTYFFENGSQMIGNVD